MRLLIATTNLGKLEEIRGLLHDLGLDVIGLSDIPPVAEPEETGHSFAANACRKARYYAAKTGQVAVAEDSGLVIDGLDGAPGVHSARFGGDTSYPEKFTVIYDRLSARARLGSPARFVCALAVARATEIVFEAEGVVEGRIADAPSGAGGFGYDPIFYYPPYGRTLADVSREEKMAVSHRGHAVRALRQWLGSLGSGRMKAILRIAPSRR